jgi:hypothetical protein
MRTQRKGFVLLRLTVNFPLHTGRNAITFSKKYEVMDIREDLLLGIETHKLLFPSSDTTEYGAKPSNITDFPHHVLHHTTPAIQANTVIQQRHIHTNDCLYGDGETDEHSCVPAIVIPEYEYIHSHADQPNSNNNNNTNSIHATTANIAHVSDIDPDMYVDKDIHTDNNDNNNSSSSSSPSS